MWSKKTGATAMAMPKIKKGLSIKPKRPFGLHAAFSSGGKQAFNDPSTAVAPDQAFGAAMAQPQGGASPSLPTLPTSLPTTTG